MRQTAAGAGHLWDELKHFRGCLHLGKNATGVIDTNLHFTGDEIIVEETMPGEFVQEIIDAVAALSLQAKRRRPGGHLIGQLPLPIWRGWRKQWEAGPKQNGVLWRAFMTSKLMDRDWGKFRVQGAKGNYVHGQRLRNP